jgi:hypothetical protein
MQNEITFWRKNTRAGIGGVGNFSMEKVQEKLFCHNLKDFQQSCQNVVKVEALHTGEEFLDG